jgi:predicted RNase H-like HicB family nuclease
MVMVEKYTVIIWWSEEYQLFLASVPDLPECLADGSTQAEALAAIHRVASEWIEVATEAGMPIPCPTPHFAPELARAA